MKPILQKWISVDNALPNKDTNFHLLIKSTDNLDYTRKTIGYFNGSIWKYTGLHPSEYPAYYREQHKLPEQEKGTITVTFDPATHKLMPINPENEMLEGAFAGITYSDEHSYLGVERHIYDYWMLAAPELGSE